MKLGAIGVVAVLVGITLAGCMEPRFTPPPPPGDPGPGWSLADVETKMVADGFQRPVAVVPHPEGGLTVVEQDGTIQWLDSNGARRVLLDVSDEVATCHFEQGLLGLAFHPSQPAMFVTFTKAPCDRAGENPARVGDVVLRRYHLDGGAPVNGTDLLVIGQPYRNHNGGHITFGPDGYLWMGVGDGGHHGDPENHGQNPRTLLGSLLRLDVDDAIRAAAGNPFEDGEDGHPYVWAYGLRNPWRFSIDDGHVWIGDVGQDCLEEINRVPIDQPGANFGWNLYEADRVYQEGRLGPRDCDDLTKAKRSLDFVWPRYRYGHANVHCSVTGGHVYQGSIEGLRGAYVFGDFCSGMVWSLRNGTVRPLANTGFQLASFGLDEDGELLLVHLGGSVHRLVPIMGAAA